MRAAGLAPLLAVRETGTVTAAAERLHLSQPAVTRQLQQLAREVGVELLIRRGRGVVLTPAGRRLADLTERHAAEWDATVRALRGQGGAPLRLGCGTTIALALLPDALTILRGLAPQAAIEVHALDSARTAARLLAGDVDAGLVTTAPLDRRLEPIPLLRDPVVAVGPPGAPDRLDLVALVSQPLCLYSRGTGFRAFLDERLGRAGVAVRPVAEMDSLEALREMVAAGLGLSLLPRSVVATALREGRIVRVEVPELADAGRTIALVRHATAPDHPAFAPLRAALVRAAALLRQGLDGTAPGGRPDPQGQESPYC